jgi:hypothetical protein
VEQLDLSDGNPALLQRLITRLQCADNLTVTGSSAIAPDVFDGAVLHSVRNKRPTLLFFLKTLLDGLRRSPGGFAWPAPPPTSPISATPLLSSHVPKPLHGHGSVRAGSAVLVDCADTVDEATARMLVQMGVRLRPPTDLAIRRCTQRPPATTREWTVCCSIWREQKVDLVGMRCQRDATDLHYARTSEVYCKLPRRCARLRRCRYRYRSRSRALPTNC